MDDDLRDFLERANRAFDLNDAIRAELNLLLADLAMLSLALEEMGGSTVREVLDHMWAEAQSGDLYITLEQLDARVASNPQWTSVTLLRAALVRMSRCVQILLDPS